MWNRLKGGTNSTLVLFFQLVSGSETKKKWIVKKFRNILKILYIKDSVELPKWTWRRNWWNWPNSDSEEETDFTDLTAIWSSRRSVRSPRHMEDFLYWFNIRNLSWTFGCKFVISPDNLGHFYILMIFIAWSQPTQDWFLETRIYQANIKARDNSALQVRSINIKNVVT